LKRNKKTIKDLFRAKKERRKNLAKLPIEEKVKILVRLQKLAAPLLLAQGLSRKPWKI